MGNQVQRRVNQAFFHHINKEVDIKYYALICLLVASTATAGDWEAKTTTDAMTDATSTEAFVTNADGDKFTMLRRSDGTVWGYIELSGIKQFSVNERLMVRVDKNDPVEFNEDFEKLSRELKMPMDTWEWNPNLIGFRMWHGKFNEGCGMVQRLFKGQQLIIRYHPNPSTISDVVFPLYGNQKTISDAVGFDVATCPAA